MLVTYTCPRGNHTWQASAPNFSNPKRICSAHVGVSSKRTFLPGEIVTYTCPVGHDWESPVLIGAGPKRVRKCETHKDWTKVTCVVGPHEHWRAKGTRSRRRCDEHINVCYRCAERPCRAPLSGRYYADDWLCVECFRSGKRKYYQDGPGKEAIQRWREKKRG